MSSDETATQEAVEAFGRAVCRLGWDVPAERAAHIDSIRLGLAAVLPVLRRHIADEDAPQTLQRLIADERHGRALGWSVTIDGVTHLLELDAVELVREGFSVSSDETATPDTRDSCGCAGEVPDGTVPEDAIQAAMDWDARDGCLLPDRHWFAGMLAAAWPVAERFWRGRIADEIHEMGLAEIRFLAGDTSPEGIARRVGAEDAYEAILRTLRRTGPYRDGDSEVSR